MYLHSTVGELCGCMLLALIDELIQYTIDCSVPPPSLHLDGCARGPSVACYACEHDMCSRKVGEVKGSALGWKTEREEQGLSDGQSRKSGIEGKNTYASQLVAIQAPICASALLRLHLTSPIPLLLLDRLPEIPQEPPPPLLAPPLLPPHVRALRKEVHHLLQTIIMRNHHEHVRVRINLLQLPNRAYRLLHIVRGALPARQVGDFEERLCAALVSVDGLEQRAGTGMRAVGDQWVGRDVCGQGEVGGGPELAAVVACVAAHEDER